MRLLLCTLALFVPLTTACSKEEAKAPHTPSPPPSEGAPAETEPAEAAEPKAVEAPTYERPEDREDPDELIAFDLLPCGDDFHDLTIQAPRGATARGLNTECRLSHGPDFRLVIRQGPAGIPATRDALDSDETVNFRAVVDSAELLVYETGPDDQPSVRFITQVSVGDRLMTCRDAAGDTRLTAPRVQELARSCRSLARR